MNFFDKRYPKVLSEEAIDNLYRMCEIDKEDNEMFLNISDFATKYAIVDWGYENDEYDDNQSGLINSSGKFVEIQLDNNFIYQDGQILQSKSKEPVYCKLKFHEIHVNNKSESDFAYFESTGFFVCYISIYDRAYSLEPTMDYWYVLDPNLKVIASFEDKHYYGVEYDGFYCDSYKTMDFWFPFHDYNFLAFKKHNTMWCMDSTFWRMHYEEDEEWMYDLLNEWEIEEFKYNQMKFYDSLQNKKFKYYLEEPFCNLYGIIDCKTHSKKQLIPFTPSKEYAEDIIRDRIHEQKNPSRCRSWGLPDWGGDVLSDKFIPSGRLKGFTLKYAAKYYPDTLLEYIKNQMLLIPIYLLKSIVKNKLYREIGILQDSNLQFKEINSKNQILESDLFYDVISIFQGKTLKQVLSTKGGTEYLVHMISSGALKIDDNLLSEMLSNNNDKTEVKRIKSLIDTKKEREERIRAYEEWQNWSQNDSYDDYNAYYDDDYETYNKYRGSYAQDVEGWSDQDIDNVFDGDPDAYWNID